MTRREIAVLMMAAGASAQPAHLVYQKRGRYREGIRTAPSSGPALDLIAAMADYREPHGQPLPPMFRARFYLPKPDPAFLTIRETQPDVYFYWLESPQDEQQTWAGGKANVFEWPTATVIQSLTDKGPLTLDDLAAVVRIGRKTPGLQEVVAPVALYHAKPPQTVESYRFVFRPSERMRLQFTLSGESQKFPRVMGGQPHAVTWDFRKRAEGWHQIAITGYALSNNAPVDATVRFYHAPRL